MLKGEPLEGALRKSPQLAARPTRWQSKTLIVVVISEFHQVGIAANQQRLHCVSRRACRCVVQQLAKIGKLQKGKTFANDVQLKLKPGTDPKNLRLVAFVQSSGPGKLLGAALWKALPGKTCSDISARRTPSSPRSRLRARIPIMSALAVFRSIRLT